MSPDREALGRLVREVRLAWAREQPRPKRSWLLPWEALTEREREVDRRIGERLYRAGLDAAPGTWEELRDAAQAVSDIIWTHCAVDATYAEVSFPDGSPRDRERVERLRAALAALPARPATVCASPSGRGSIGLAGGGER